MPPTNKFLVSVKSAQFYKYGPAQAFGADFTLAQGQKVTMLERQFGFSRVMLEAYPNLILNIHPSLLPSFPGRDVQHQALHHGVKFSGCTVHIVNDVLDGGPIVLQAVVPVLDRDDADALAARILVEEHRIFSEAIDLVLSGRCELAGRRITVN